MPLVEDAPVATAAEPPITRAAGVLFVAPNGNILLVHRTDGQGWAFPGGGIEEGESAEDAARREVLEETGCKYEGPLSPWTRCVSNNVDFTTFLARAPQFEPVLNVEHDRYQWVDREFALNTACGPSGLHTGVPIALRRFDMDELSIAKAIRDGQLTSPQRYRNLLLVAIRITGTGAAYRSTGDEFVWRDPSIYMNEEFLQRCNGLFVILQHPPKKPMLTTQEFRKRIVGSVFLPYLKPEAYEVWGIAKIADMDIADMLEKEQMSTSPGVLFVKSELRRELEAEDGSTIVIEGEPCLLDHIALCPYGVWDKGGEPTGVDSIEARNDSEESTLDPKLDSMLQHLKIDELYRRVSRF